MEDLTPPAEPIHLYSVLDDSVALVRRWLHESQPNDTAADDASQVLADLLGDEFGLAFLSEYLDGVVLPEDAFVAAVNLKRLAQNTPPVLPRRTQLAVRGSGFASLTLPWAVIPFAKNVLRKILGGLLVDAVSAETNGDATVLLPGVSVCGDGAFGEEEAGRRLDAVNGLIGREGVGASCYRWIR